MRALGAVLVLCSGVLWGLGRARALGERERLTEEEIRQYAAKAIQTGNIAKCAVRPTQTDLEEMYRESLG